MREVRGRDVVLLVAFLSCLLLGANYRLFLDPLAESEDFAANSLLVLQAKRGLLLHGNYSRLGFHHPGPGLIWVHAAGEVAFHDVLGVVPAPFNGQIVGCLFLEAGLIGLALALAGLVWGRVSPVPVLLPLWLGHLAWAEAFASTWFPNLYCPVYLALQMSAVAVAAGHHRALPWLAATGGLAIHGHVCFVLFTAALTAFAVAGMVWVYRGQVREVWGRGRAVWVAAVAVWAAFAAPILAHTWWDYPGEVWRIVGYRRAANAPTQGVAEAAAFVWRVVSGGDTAGGFAAGLVAAASVGLGVFGHRLGPAAVRRAVAERSWGRVAGAVLGVAAVSTACVLYYSVEGVDNLSYPYTIRFYRTTLPVAGLLVVYWLDAAGLGRRAASPAGVAVSAAACVGIAAAGLFTWAGPKFAGGGVEAADQIAADPRWATRRPVVMLELNHWQEAAAVVVRLARRGRVPYVLAPGMIGIIFPREYQPDAAALAAADPWVIDVTGAAPADAPALHRRRLGGWPGPEGYETVASEITPAARFGDPVAYVSIARALELVTVPAADGPVRVGPGAGSDALTLPVRVEFDAPPPARVGIMFLLSPMASPRAAGTFGGLDVFVNGYPAGRVSYPLDRGSLHGLPVPVPAADLARPALVTFRLVPPESERDAVLPSAEHYHAVFVTGLQFGGPRPNVAPK